MSLFKRKPHDDEGFLPGVTWGTWRRRESDLLEALRVRVADIANDPHTPPDIAERLRAALANPRGR